MPHHQQTDVLIAGDGIAAKAAAIALRKHRPDVSVAITGQGQSQPALGETLAPGIRPYLQALDLWQPFLKQAHAPAYQSISCWDSATPRDNPFLLSTEGHGWHLDRPLFGQLLWDKALALGANHWQGWVQHAQREGKYWHIRLGKQNIQARFLLDATGRNAAIARRLGAKKQQYDDLLATICRYQPTQTQQISTLIEACEQGWWYSAGVPDGSTLCAFMTDSQPTTSHWQQALQQAPLTQQRLQTAQLTAKRFHRVAASQCIDQPAGSWWAAIGDAAQSYDPLSSDGIRKALHDGLGISVLVEAWLADGAASGQALTERYCRAQSRSFSYYLTTQRAFYRQETRWPHSPFWAKRQQNKGDRL